MMALADEIDAFLTKDDRRRHFTEKDLVRRGGARTALGEAIEGQLRSQLRTVQIVLERSIPEGYHAEANSSALILSDISSAVRSGMKFTEELERWGDEAEVVRTLFKVSKRIDETMEAYLGIRVEETERPRKRARVTHIESLSQDASSEADTTISSMEAEENPGGKTHEALYDEIERLIWGMGVRKVDRRQAMEMLTEASYSQDDAVVEGLKGVLMDGLLHVYDKGVDHNKDHSLSCWKLARQFGLAQRANQGDRWAQYLKGHMFLYGKGVAKDYKKAMKYARLAAEWGVSAAHILIGFVYFSGHGVTIDKSKALEHYRKASDAGNVVALMFVGDCLSDGGTPHQNGSEAFRCYKLAGDQGLVNAFNSIGFMYDAGDGTEQNYKQALWHFKRGAYEKQPMALFNIGLMYERGDGVDEDLFVAQAFFQLAAEQGDGDAQFECGRIYELPHEYGVELIPDLDEALKYYKRSSSNGKGGADLCAGQIYQCGWHEQIDLGASVDCYTKLKDRGAAHQFLGFMNRHGVGMPMDENKAMEHFKFAVQKSDRDAQLTLGSDIVNSRDSKMVEHADIASAQQLLVDAAELNNATATAYLGKLYLTTPDLRIKDANCSTLDVKGSFASAISSGLRPYH